MHQRMHLRPAVLSRSIARREAAGLSAVPPRWSVPWNRTPSARKARERAGNRAWRATRRTFLRKWALGRVLSTFGNQFALRRGGAARDSPASCASEDASLLLSLHVCRPRVSARPREGSKRTSGRVFAGTGVGLEFDPEPSTSRTRAPPRNSSASTRCT